MAWVSIQYAARQVLAVRRLMDVNNRSPAAVVLYPKPNSAGRGRSYVYLDDELNKPHR